MHFATPAKRGVKHALCVDSEHRESIYRKRTFCSYLKCDAENVQIARLAVAVILPHIIKFVTGAFADVFAETDFEAVARPTPVFSFVINFVGREHLNR